MDQPMLPPGSEDESSVGDLSSNFPLAGKLSEKENNQLIKWLGAVTRVLHSAVASADFYERAAKEMVDLIGLDSGRVLEIVEGGRWTVAASYHRGARPGPSSEWVPISSLIRQRDLTKSGRCWTTPSGQYHPHLAGTEDVTGPRSPPAARSHRQGDRHAVRRSARDEDRDWGR